MFKNYTITIRNYVLNTKFEHLAIFGIIIVFNKNPFSLFIQEINPFAIFYFYWQRKRIFMLDILGLQITIKNKRFEL